MHIGKNNKKKPSQIYAVAYICMLSYFMPKIDFLRNARANWVYRAEEEEVMKMYFYICHNDKQLVKGQHVCSGKIAGNRA